MSDSVEAQEVVSAGVVVSAPPAEAVGRVLVGVKWLWAIVGASGISFLAQVSGWGFYMLVGMGIPVIAGAVMGSFGGSTMVVSGLVAALLLIGFAGLAWFASGGRRWAFVVAGVVYLIDAILLALLGEWPSVAFHCVALWFVAQGWLAMGTTGPIAVSYRTPRIGATGGHLSAPVAPSAGRFLKLVIVAIGATVLILAMIMGGVWLTSRP